VYRAVDGLTPAELQIIDLIHEGLTQQEMAEKLSVSQPRIYQLKASAIKKIKKALSPNDCGPLSSALET
jgi:RNA polymerase sigma factor (sigma-70 family)